MAWFVIASLHMWDCSWSAVPAQVSSIFMIAALGDRFQISPAASPETLHPHMENVAFYRLLRWKMIILPILTTSRMHFSLGRLGEVLGTYFWCGRALPNFALFFPVARKDAGKTWIPLCEKNAEPMFHVAIWPDLLLHLFTFGTFVQSGRHATWICKAIALLPKVQLNLSLMDRHILFSFGDMFAWEYSTHRIIPLKASHT